MKQFHYIGINEFNQNELRGFFNHQIKTLSRHNIHLYNIVTGHVQVHIVTPCT